MWFVHLQLLIEKSLRYAWRLRLCRCFPKIILELLFPCICLLFLTLIRWSHTPTNESHGNDTLNEKRPSAFQIQPSTIVPSIESIYFFNYTTTYECPSPKMAIEIADKNLYTHFKSKCPESGFIFTSESMRQNASFLLNTSAEGYQINFRCQYENNFWCKNMSELSITDVFKSVEHPSKFLCQDVYFHGLKGLLRTYLSISSLLKSPTKLKSLLVYTWPCSSYGSDPLFHYFPSFALVMILIFLDGCILYGFNLLFNSLIDEKHEGITELLRLISIRPILNSFSWFLRGLIIQFIPNMILILIFTSSIEGGIYFEYVPMWLIVPSIFLWTIQTFSRAVFVGHFFTSTFKATLWSWIVYVISFWFAISPPMRIPGFLHIIASIWLPFYSIKRLFILLFRMNTDLGRGLLINDILLVWLYMTIGSFLMWLLAYYFEQVRPGKYGIPRSWSWPLDNLRNYRAKAEKRRESVAMQMVETLPDVNKTISVNNLTKTYGGYGTEKQLAVDHISFKLEKSKIHGLIGHNGAGKTTTMEMLCGLLSCDCGTIEIHEQDLYENLSQLQKYIGYCPQQDMLFSYLTVQEQLEFYARVRSEGGNVNYNQIQQLLAMMDMSNVRDRLCHALSGGMQRKLSILCAFVGPVNVIILGKT